MNRSGKYFLVLLIAFFVCFSSRGASKTDSLSIALGQSKADTARVNILIKLSWEHRNSNPDTALYFAGEGLKLAQKLRYSKGIASCLNNSGVVYYSISNFDEALNCFNRSLVVYNSLGDKKAMSKNYNNIGNIYRAQSNFPQAISFLLKSLAIREELSDSAGMSSCYNNIGLVYSDQGDLDIALGYFQKSLAIKKKLNELAGMYFTCTNIGNIYFKKNLNEKALEQYNMALKIATETNNRIGMATTYNNIGSIYYETQKYQVALVNFEQSLLIAGELRDLSGVAIAHMSIGNTHEKMGDFQGAIKSLLEAVDIAKAIGLKDALKNAYNGLATTFERMGEPVKALEYYKLFTRVKDEVLNEQNSEKMAEMITRFDTEKKEKEITLLTKDSQIQSLAFSKNEAELKKQKLVNYSVIAGLLLVVLLAVFVYRGYRQKQKANLQLEEKNSMIEEKNKEITDSIIYAEKIQRALLPSTAEFETLLPQSFVLFRPKDIVSGDFYWIAEVGGEVFYAAVDCTGHGVPGGFMSMLGTSLLNEIVIEKKITEPCEVLDMLRIKIVLALKQTGASGENKDGMDMIFCRINKKTNTLVYAAANNPLWIVRKNELLEFAADKQPVGVTGGNSIQFSQHSIALEKDDMIYALTDGYPDQFGGPKGKKFKYKQLEQFLVTNHKKEMEVQRTLLEEALDNWRGGLEQVDDILIIGVRV